MQAVILAGGRGTRISEESILKPLYRDWRKTNYLAYNEKLFISRNK